MSEQLVAAINAKAGRAVITPTRLEQVTVPACARSTAVFLRELADRIEAREGDDILIGLWNTGFGEPEEFCFQVVISEEQG